MTDAPLQPRMDREMGLNDVNGLTQRTLVRRPTRLLGKQASAYQEGG
jgi:hypothetical protein